MATEDLGFSKMRGNSVISLPKKVRDALGIKNGDMVIFFKDGDRVTVRKGAVKPI
jgi:AbrB family looped-hinge helix DNA binding protein